MAYGGYKYINKRRRGTREESRKHQIQSGYGDEQADAGRDCRTRLARPNSQARTRTGNYSFFPVQLTTCRIGNLTRLIHTLARCDDHTYHVWNELLHVKCVTKSQKTLQDPPSDQKLPIDASTQPTLSHIHHYSQSINIYIYDVCMYVFMVITDVHGRAWIKQVKLSILLVVS